MKNAEDSLKLACALNDREFAERRKWVRGKLLPLVERVEQPDGAVHFVFSEFAERADVETFAELERQCCGFLKFELSPNDVPLTLTITGPEDSQPILDAFAGAAAQ